MSGQTEYVSLTTSAYSALSSGHSTVRVIAATAGLIRVHMGSSLPSASTSDWYLLGEEEEQFENLDDGTNIYAISGAGLAAVRVIRI